MIQISIDDFISGINSIYNEKPAYKSLCDGSNGFCDEIGFVRGALIRGGATSIKDMKEMNQFVRNVATNIHRIDGKLSRGNILLNMVSGECINVAVVVSVDPLKIRYYGLDGVGEADTADGWNCVCEIPYIKYNDDDTVYIIHNDDGKVVRMYSTPSFTSPMIDIPNNSEISIVDEIRRPWTLISFGLNSGYVLSRYIKPITQTRQPSIKPQQSISGFDRSEIEKAYVILGKLLGYIK